jgi:ubiquinone/menaquinone biosynthesis C-methylase UbiE
VSTSGHKQVPRSVRAPSSPTAAEASDTAFLRKVTGHYPKFIPFLTRKVGVQFSGRILELGAGAGWFSAELSKLPKVVEVIATDFRPRTGSEQAPRVFKELRAQEAKITRLPIDAHRLNFPNNHFDFVVCAGVLHEALNLLHLLGEIRRVLKPGGQLVAVREPVRPAVDWRPRAGTPSQRAMKTPLYSRTDYEAAFDRAGLKLTVHRVSLATGLKYYFDTVVNGLTHARYAFIAVKRSRH